MKGKENRYQRAGAEDRRIARGDDFAADGWLDTATGEIKRVAVGYNPNLTPEENELARRREIAARPAWMPE